MHSGSDRGAGALARASVSQSGPGNLSDGENTMSMSDRDGWIWYDGKLVPWREANTHVLTHSLHYGLSIFEGVRAYNTVDGPAIFRLREHTERLFNSARVYMMNIPFTQEQINDAHREVIRANKLDGGYLRPIVFYGSEKLGVSPKGNQVHVAIAAWPWGAYLGEEGLKRGIRVKTSSYQRHHINVSMVRTKTGGNYVNSILANMEAINAGYDEALLLDTQGFVAEGAGENLFIVRDGKVFEPNMVSGLIGITRRTVIDLAAELGYTVTQMPMTRDDVYLADEAFFTGTAAEVTPIRELDGRAIGAGSRGPVTEKIQTMFFDAVNGRVPKFKHWLTPV
jgi:branched-chain amino acid aminotransferase